MKVGILGGGQLARMLALAGYPLGIQTLCMDPTPDTCASQVTTVICADYNDPATLKHFLQDVTVVTFETENIPVEVVEKIQQTHAVFPNGDALAVTQDRVAEKTLCQRLAIPTTRFIPIDSLSDLQAAQKVLGYPAVLKTRRLGYDGKGQYVLREEADIALAWKSLGGQGLILEEWVAFQREVSLISVRGQDGTLSFYPLSENYHYEGILAHSLAPCPVPSLQSLAQDYAQKILQELDYVGVFAIEFFEMQGKLMVNEMAPRVHNSGHWTIEGAQTSQFENHLRAITGLPLGSTEARGVSIMVNCVGTEPLLSDVLKVPGAHYHTYGKEPRPKRKLGHITRVVAATDPQTIKGYLEQLKAIIGSPY